MRDFVARLCVRVLVHVYSSVDTHMRAYTHAWQYLKEGIISAEDSPRLFVFEPATVIFDVRKPLRG